MDAIYNNKYQRIGWLSNESENGIHFEDDQLETSIEQGLYSYKFNVPKDTPKTGLLSRGNLIETRTIQGKPLLMTIMEVVENRHDKTVYCMDTNIIALNSHVDGIEAPNAPESLDYYVNHALQNSDFIIRENESDQTLKVEFSSTQRILDRLRSIALAFGLEIEFDLDFIPGSSPKRYVSFKKKRVEDFAGFRVSSDDLVEGMEKSQNIYNLATKLKVRGATVSSTSGDTTAGTTGAVNTQVTATNFDSSKANGATAVITNGWVLSEVNSFKLNQADPPHVTGAYIDTFLRTYYSDSPLIGQGAVIKDLADYFGIAVGAVMGVFAKETTFGRGHPGKVDYNYGCIRHTSEWPAVWYGGSAWNKYPDKRTGIASWMKLIRWSYLEPGSSYYSTNYKQMLDFYSPTSENDQATFKNIMWGVLKSFGYVMGDSTVKKNFSKASDDPRTVKTTRPVEGAGTPSEPAVDTVVEKAIAEAHRISALKLPYVWGGNGPNGYDCSGFTNKCYTVAGVNLITAQAPRPYTNSIYNQIGPFKRITRAELRRGDLILYDTGYTFPGDPNHIGLYLGPSIDAPNSVIHAGNPVGIKQRADSMSIVGYVRVVY